jgi:hypothetical protein
MPPARTAKNETPRRMGHNTTVPYKRLFAERFTS